MSDFTHIAWTDLETTGLDHERGDILEYGIILTTRDLEIVAVKSDVVVPPQLDILRLHPAVREMHTKNELLDAVFEMCVTGLGSASISSRDIQVHAWLYEQLGRDGIGKVALGGSGVSHFDVRWINKWMPHFASWLYRSTVDVGVIRRFIENVVDMPELVPAEHRVLSHRALDDAEDHLNEARHYRKMLREVRDERRDVISQKRIVAFLEQYRGTAFPARTLAARLLNVPIVSERAVDVTARLLGSLYLAGVVTVDSNMRYSIN